MIIGNNDFQKKWNHIKEEGSKVNTSMPSSQNHFIDVMNTNDMVDGALNILNQRYQNGLISHEEYRRKSQELLRKKNKPLT